ncbi:MAG: glycosyltransferase family 4 protein, partial [Cyclobacteriaceae bacterium]|nr:glycosyltransferase family 4 protein [Cyclobacteriaceae bacterium]
NFKVVTPGRFALKSYWRSRGILSALASNSIDLYHGLSHEIPFGLTDSPIKSVVTVHDIIHKIYPGQYSFIDRSIYDQKLKYSAVHADAVVAVSESTKADLIRYYHIAPEKIHVVYQGIGEVFYRPLEARVLEETKGVYDLPERYLLYVGSIIRRKNLLSLVKAFHQLRDRIDHTLIVIGDGGDYKEEVKKFIVENGLKERVRFLQNVRQEELPPLYRLADVFIYPSEYEGFGIPLVEALSQNTPVITTRKSSLKEVGGDAATYVEPEEISAFAEKMFQLITNQELRSSCISKGKEQIALFDKKKIARQMMDIYEMIS